MLHVCQMLNANTATTWKSFQCLRKHPCYIISSTPIVQKSNLSTWELQTQRLVFIKTINFKSHDAKATIFSTPLINGQAALNASNLSARADPNSMIDGSHDPGWPHCPAGTFFHGTPCIPVMFFCYLSKVCAYTSNSWIAQDCRGSVSVIPCFRRSSRGR